MQTMYWFEHEVRAMEIRFNQVFGQAEVCEVQARTQVLLAIIGLALSKDAVARAADQAQRKQRIAEFVRKRNTIRDFLDSVESKTDTNKQDMWQEMAKTA